jgi:hypothetical protein
MDSKDEKYIFTCEFVCIGVGREEKESWVKTEKVPDSRMLSREGSVAKMDIRLWVQVPSGSKFNFWLFVGQKGVH